MKSIIRIPHFTLTSHADEVDSAQTLDAMIFRMLMSDSNGSPNEEILRRVRAYLDDVISAAFQDGFDHALDEVHRALFLIYEITLIDPFHPAAKHQHAPWLLELRNGIEQAFLNADVKRISRELPPEADLESPEIIGKWFHRKAATRTAIDLRVEDFLEHHMGVEDLKNFILNDAFLNSRFYDTLVLSAMFYADFVKQEIAQHLWEECGEGTIANTHTTVFARSLRTLDLKLGREPIWTDWRPYAGFNLHFLLGLSRCHYFKALGSLAMPELFDPLRNRAFNAGIRRLGFSPERDFTFYFAHEKIDILHGQNWVRNIIEPIVRKDPRAGHELAVGGALRMLAFRRYNAYLADLFGLSTDLPQASAA
ncbi:MAG TPA: iron-containing redox enzyme family protein [Candidatus Baltobacteraceae bacterium]|jgi:hypothetical protein|nr:iron-containing redox enzyme family protein [Candidatus Baltobacteraceae bacterium]